MRAAIIYVRKKPSFDHQRMSIYSTDGRVDDLFFRMQLEDDYGTLEEVKAVASPRDGEIMLNVVELND